MLLNRKSNENNRETGIHKSLWIPELLVIIGNFFSSSSTSSLFLINTFDNLEHINILPKDSLSSFNYLSTEHKKIYIVTIFFDVILFLSMLKSNDRLMRMAVNHMTNLNINEKPLDFWKNCCGIICENSLAILASMYMSFVNSLNMYSVSEDIIDSKGITISLSSLTLLSSEFCLWTYFKYQKKKNMNNFNKRRSLSPKQARLIKFLFFIFSGIYGLGNSFLFMNTINQISKNFNFSFDENDSSQNLEYGLVIALVGIPTAHMIFKTYYGLLKKHYNLIEYFAKDNKKIEPCKNISNKFEKIYVAFIRSLLLALSINLLFSSFLKGNIRYLAFIPATIALFSNSASRISLYISGDKREIKKSLLKDNSSSFYSFDKHNKNNVIDLDLNDSSEFIKNSTYK